MAKVQGESKKGESWSHLFKVIKKIYLGWNKILFVFLERLNIWSYGEHKLGMYFEGWHTLLHILIGRRCDANASVLGALGCRDLVCKDSLYQDIQ